MAGINKNFVVKHGLQVSNNLIVADETKYTVGIGTSVSNSSYRLHVNGGIGATDLKVSGIGTFDYIHLNGTVAAGTSQGAIGQYLVRVGTGVTWQNLPSTRSSQTFTASVGQTVFFFSYTVGYLDVFVNGVKLSSSEYTANDTASVILNTACFGEETVELISYSSVNPGYGYTGIYGISLFEDGSPVGTTGQVVALNFVGAAVTATATGVAATVYLTENWTKNSQGVYSLNSVGVGTTNPRFALEVGAVGASGTSLWVNGNARVTGILTVGSSSIVLDGSNNTINVGSGVTINGNTGIVSASNFYANGIQVGVISATTIVYQGSTLASSQWVTTAAGIHTLSSVGIGTTNPTSALTVVGSGTSTSQLYVTGVSTFTGTTNLATTNISGDLTFTGNNDLYLKDNGVINFGDSNDLQIYHNSSVSVISDGGTGGLLIQSDNEIKLAKNGTGNDNLAVFTPDGPVELYYDNSKKFETLGAGVTVTGTTFTNQLSVSGVSTFKNTVSVDNYLVVNQTSTNPSVTVDVGGNTAIAMYYDTSSLQSYLYSGNKNLNIKVYSPQNVNIMSGDYNLASFNSNSAAQLYKGVIVTGSTTTDQLSVSGVSTCTGSVRVGVSTAAGVILTSPNGTKYQLFVENGGTLKTVAV
jgi:hypothetical protein